MQRALVLVLLLGLVAGCGHWIAPAGMTEQQARWELWDCDNRTGASTARAADWNAAYERTRCLNAKGFVYQR